MKSQLSMLAVAAGMTFVVGAPAQAQCESSKSMSTAQCPSQTSVELAAGVFGDPDIVDTAIEAGSFKTLVAAVQAAGLVEALRGEGPFTVFAPTDDAFAKLPAGTVESLLRPENKGKLAAILTYHVVPGRVMAKDVIGLSNANTLNGQRIDIKVNGGKVMTDNHVIDTVILPSLDDIVDTAGSAGKFNTLIAAVQAAGLEEALRSKGPFTVMAPTDEAFAKLPAGTLDSLLLPENREMLASILKYHVIPGRVFSPDALKAKMAATLQGQKVTFSVQSGQPMCNNAKILATDIDAANGVIHVIDTVILPK
ncbi:MAG: fasciclin domain-containing protein [Planctomycetota bacterium]|jgi:uncharacterized surface protein with fasciclin (FAS1) repeats